MRLRASPNRAEKRDPMKFTLASRVSAFQLPPSRGEDKRECTKLRKGRRDISPTAGAL